MSNLADAYHIVSAAISKGIQPDPNLWVDEWAEEFMVIPKGAEPGRYRVARTPYAREPMQWLSPDHPCKRVAIVAASQMLKTQVGLNWIGASIHQAPANILVLLPTLPLAKRVSSRISDTINAVPVLKERVAQPRSRDSRNTLDTKEFEGGAVYITTAGSAANLAEIPVRYVYADEIDRWERDLDGEGDPVELAEARASTYELNKKLYYTSSPTLHGQSRIDKLYQQGDQRKYHVPCPHCGEQFELTWDQVRHDDALTHAWLECPANGCVIEEHEKPRMLEAGTWVASATGDGETVSAHISALYMPIGWVSWLGLARQYVKASIALERGDQGPMQVFYNTRLALCWDSAEERTPASELKKRAEPYPLRTVPRGGLVLTAAVDTQPNRLEVQIVAWGVGMERWIVDYQVLWGSPSEDEVWTNLDTILRTPLQHAGGRFIAVSATFIDSGGANTQDVYGFVRTRKHRKIFAIKGASKPNRPVLSAKPSKVDINHRGRTEKQGADLWFIGTDVAKDWIYARYKLTAGPGSIHFSNELPDEFYEQMVVERKLIKYRKGHAYSEWFKDNGDRNEALDCQVYNLGAAHFLGLHRKREEDWQAIRVKLEPLTGDLFAEPPPALAPPPAAAPGNSTPAPVPAPPSPAPPNEVVGGTGSISLAGWKRAK